MKLKKLIGISLCMAMTAALCACSSSEAEEATDTVATEKAVTEEATETPTEEETDLGLLTAGALSIGVEIGYPPFEDFAEDGVTPIGYDIDFSYALAEKLGLEVNFINTAWDGIFSGIGTNYDVVISAVTINDERKQTMDFSDPYINNYQAIVVPKGSDLTFTSLNDMNGMAVALQKETTSDELISDMIATGTIDATVVANEKVITCFTQLTNGEVDCILCDSTVADGYLASDPDSYEKAFQDDTSPEQFGVAMTKGNTALQEAINAAIAELTTEGFFDDNTAKWFGAGD